MSKLYFINITYKRDSDNDDGRRHLLTMVPIPMSAAPEPAAADAAATEADCCEFCIFESRDGFALVPCGPPDTLSFARVVP